MWKHLWWNPTLLRLYYSVDWNLTKMGLHHSCFQVNFSKTSEQLFYKASPWQLVKETAKEERRWQMIRACLLFLVLDLHHSFCHLSGLSIQVICERCNKDLYTGLIFSMQYFSVIFILILLVVGKNFLPILA